MEEQKEILLAKFVIVAAPNCPGRLERKGKEKQRKGKESKGRERKIKEIGNGRSKNRRGKQFFQIQTELCSVVLGQNHNEHLYFVVFRMKC